MWHKILIIFDNFVPIKNRFEQNQIARLKQRDMLRAKFKFLVEKSVAVNRTCFKQVVTELVLVLELDLVEEVETLRTGSSALCGGAAVELGDVDNRDVCVCLHWCDGAAL